MSSKKDRLNVKQFSNVMKTGKSYRSTSFVLKIYKNDLNSIRIGVGVSRDLAKNSVKRNYHKRVLRSILKEVLEGSNIGYDLAMIISSKALNKKNEELKNEASILLHKTELFYK